MQPRESGRPRIRVALAGVGNCASALVQGVAQAAAQGSVPGTRREMIGAYRITDIQFVAAFDVDARKVGQDLSKAIFTAPNCAAVFQADVPSLGVTVMAGPVLDGVSTHMADEPEARSVRLAIASPVDVARVLRDTGAEVLINFLPVGSQRATEHYMTAALEAGVGVVNAIPVFIASHAEWGSKFARNGLPIIGDDVKSQFGATLLHRALTRLLTQQGYTLDRTYQLNIGGNTDFLNMRDPPRLADKRVSKTAAVQSQLPEPLAADNVHIGPSDYVPWLKDTKVCYLRVEGRGFGGARMDLEVRLAVEDSPNSAGVVVDAIRLCRLARDRGLGGALIAPSAALMKHPPQPMPDAEAEQALARFIEGEDERSRA